MKKFALVSLFLAAVLLTGCLSPSIKFTIRPNPIEVTFADGKLEDVELDVRLSGFSFAYRVDKAVIEVFDEKNDRIYETSEDLGATIPVIPGIAETIELPAIPITGMFTGTGTEPSEAYYNENLKGRTLTLSITLTGKNPTTAKAQLKLK